MVLDVGGGNGDFLAFCGIDGIVLETLLGSDVTEIDSPKCQFVKYAGGTLPLRDRAVRTVVCLDALEHVPAQLRETFLEELRRVSDDRVTMTFPADSQSLYSVLLLVTRLYRRLGLNAVAERNLKEHMRFGLPRSEEVISSFVDSGWRVDSIREFSRLASFTMLVQYLLPFLAFRCLDRTLAHFLTKVSHGGTSYTYLTACRQ